MQSLFCRIGTMEMVQPRASTNRRSVFSVFRNSSPSETSPEEQIAPDEHTGFRPGTLRGALVTL